MSFKAGEKISEEAHDDVDQFLRFEQGEGKAVIDGKEKPVKDANAHVSYIS